MYIEELLLNLLYINKFVSLVVFSCCFVAMEVILDELQTRGVDIDMRTLSHTINDLLERHEALYNQMIVNVNFSLNFRKNSLAFTWIIYDG